MRENHKERNRREKTEDRELLQNQADLIGFREIKEDGGHFGNRQVTIERIRIQTASRSDSVAISGEPYEIGFLIDVHETIMNPIAGYIVKDRLGRRVIGDNTLLMKAPLAPLKNNNKYLVFFRFPEWPNLLAGKYTLSIAISEGVGEKHTPCHYAQDVAVIESVPFRPPAGIFSVLNLSVDVKKITNQ